MKKIRPYLWRGGALVLAAALVVLLVLSGMGLSTQEPEPLPQSPAQTIRTEGQGGASQQEKPNAPEQPEDPALPYFFGKWETESQWQNICLAKLMVFSFLDIRVTDFQASLDQTLAAAEARFAKPYLLTEVNSGGMSFRTPAEGVR